MVDFFVGILFFVVIVIGWLFGKVECKKIYMDEFVSSVGKGYFDGFNLFFNEKWDEVVDLLLKILDVDGEMFEIYIVMGSLFWRRGEVDCVICIY